MGLKYYKKDGKAKWILADEHNPPSGMYFETVLSIESNPDDLETKLDQKYYGPFYIDIDNDSLELALDDLKKVVKYMVIGYNLKPDADLKIFATGKKGFHIELNPSLYMDSKFKPLLPYRYKLMAAGISRATGVVLDMVVYSGGKGRMWRIPNVERDNGNYKVELSYTEVLTEGIEYIEQVCKAPRPLSKAFIKTARNPLAESWFKACDIVIPKSKEVVDTKVLQASDVPDCISRLRDLDGIHSQARFNGLVLNAATYGARMSWSADQALKYFKPMLEYNSSVYKSQDDKEDHFKNVYGFVAENPEYKFDCGFICKIVDEPGCKSCPIKVGEDAEDMDEEFGIFIKNNSYYLQAAEGSRRLTGFTMKIKHDIKHDSGEILYDMELINARGKKRNIAVPESAFTTKNGFTKFLSPDFPVWCSERELAMIGWYLRKEDPKEQIGRDFIGLHWADKEWHYANDSGSVSLSGVMDKIRVNAKSLTIVNTKLDFDWPQLTKEEAEGIAASIMDFNVPQVVIPSVGWFLSSFFKPHFDKTYSQFPLLFFFGEAGAGKTSTGLLLRRLFAMSDSALKSISDVTQFSLMAACNSSNLIPLILDEYKPMMMKETQSQLVSRLIRGAYNSSRGERGTATQEIIPYYYRAPIVLLGEQSIIETAVQHRVIEVQLTRMYLNEKPDAKKHLDALKDMKLESLGKEFLTFAMSVKPEELKAKFDKYHAEYVNSLNLPERPIFNHTVLRVTFDYFIEFMALKGVDTKDKILNNFNEYEKFIRHGNSVIDSIINKNDVIKIIDIMNLLSDVQASPYPVLQNVHYAYDMSKDELYLDIETVFPLFSKYNKDYNLGLYDMGMTSFIKMLQKESFCEYIKRENSIGSKTRLIACLSISRSLEYKVNLSNFIPESMK